MKRLRLGAVLHFLIAIGHIGCLFALDEAFEAYGIREIMHQMVSGHVWMLYADHRSCPRFLPGRTLCPLCHRRHPSLSLNTYGNHYHCCAKPHSSQIDAVYHRNLE